MLTNRSASVGQASAKLRIHRDSHFDAGIDSGV
jgi:hypothetical protein